MTEISLILPEIGQADKTQDPKIVTAFTQIQTAINGNIGGVNVEPELTGYRLFDRMVAVVGAKVGAGTLFLETGGSLLPNPPQYVAGRLPYLAYYNPVDFAISGRTTMLTMKVAIFTNNVAPGATLTFGLYPIEQYGGGENELTVKYEAVVAGSTVAFVAPTATQNFQSSATFSFPAAKYYSVGVAVSAETAAKSFTCCSVQLFASNT